MPILTGKLDEVGGGERELLYSSPSKQLFSVCNRLTSREKSSPLPTTHPPRQLPDDFCDYFTRKGTDEHSDLDQQTTSSPVVCPD